ncbi:MAG: polysaccharide biosynthesis protein [Betaproteobacteria bacterium]|nr:polysaccharide biosynthesis protein [Betaproteobacteria bacterium]
MKKTHSINTRILLAFLHDVIAVACSWMLAFELRFNFDPLSEPYYYGMMTALVWVVPIHALVAWRVGLYRGMWRFASLTDLKRIVLSVSIAGLFVSACAFIFASRAEVPRAVLLLNPILIAVWMSGSRIAYRLLKERNLYGHSRLLGEPVLVAGGGDAAARLLRELASDSRWHVVGLLHSDPRRHGSEISGVKILGGWNNLEALAERLRVNQLIMAMPEAPARARREVIEAATAAGLSVQTVPAIADLLSGRVPVSQIRRVELEDLLGREEVALDDPGLHRLLAGRVVVVTGAGGSIGAELCRQIAAFEPARLICLELSEYALYAAMQEFSARYPHLPLTGLIADIKNSARLDRIFAQYKPDVIFHAAAYKHVPLMEAANAWEALTNNALGTLRLLEAAERAGAGKFVLVSTDKAVNPTNIMGASKRLAEKLCQARAAAPLPARLPVVTVRFGNVLGSTGSVIPLFRAQIDAGGPVTVTHPEITRYFMLIPEAAQLVLQAGLMGEGGEIFVLDMGDPVRIVDLARDLIKLSGLSEEEIPIVYTGLRPGEKLYEELLANDEKTLPTPHPKLRIARPESLAGVAPDAAWAETVLAWLTGPEPGPESLIRRLCALVPEYCPMAAESLKGTVQHFERPIDPVGEDDWEAAQ